MLDNLCNSSKKSLQAVDQITQRKLSFIEGDLRHAATLEDAFNRHDFQAVLHFGGLKAVGESVASPASYYDNNVVGTLRLIEAMSQSACRTLVFSSSATVYGMPEIMPIGEDCPVGAINPYGRTKQHIEEMLKDLGASSSDWRISLLRYFNPVGAHASGEIGEDPEGVPNNLMPFVSQVAVGLRPEVRVFADDYDTPDGTGVRDYIHVIDLVRGHLKALEYLSEHPGVHVHNLGTGRGYSVLEIIQAFASASNREIPYRVVERRPGDAAVSYADPSKAERELDWRAEFDLEQMCADVWRWQSSHPDGYTE